MAEVRRLDPDSLALLQGAPAAQPGVSLQDCAELQSEGSLRRREGEFQLQLHIAALRPKGPGFLFIDGTYPWSISLGHKLTCCSPTCLALGAGVGWMSPV